MGSSCECRVPQFRHRRIAPAEFARLELPLLDLLCQLDSRDRYHRVIESFESQHRPDSTRLTRTDRQSLQGCLELPKERLSRLQLTDSMRLVDRDRFPYNGVDFHYDSLWTDARHNRLICAHF